MLLAGILLYIAGIPMYFIAHTLAALVPVRFVSGIGSIGTATSVACGVPRHQQGLSNSCFSMSTAFALPLGPFLGITLAQILEYK